MIAPGVTSEQQVIVQNCPTPACYSERDSFGNLTSLALCFVFDPTVNTCRDLKPLLVCADVTSLLVCVADMTSLLVSVGDVTSL